MTVTERTAVRDEEQASPWSGLTARLRSLAGPAAVIVAVQLVLFPMPLGIWVQGITVGLLGALVAIGMALVYRSHTQTKRLLRAARSISCPSRAHG